MLFAQLEKLLGFLEVLAKRPFDEDVLTGFEGRTDGFVVAVNVNSTDDEIDVLIIDKIC